MLKRVAKVAGLVCLPILLWAIFVLFHKESLDEGLSDFYRPRQIIPQTQDATVFLNGLAAPAGKDVVEHGLLVARVYAEAGGDSSHAKHKIAALGELDPTLNADELDCWIYGPDGGTEQQPCASAKQVSSLVKKNALLLGRYQDMATLSFSGNARHNLQLFINLNRLLSAQILLEARSGKPEAAFQRWKSNFRFLERAAGSPTGWIERAVVAVNLGFAQATLESLLYSHPGLAVRHQRELLELLDTDPDIWRIDEALRGEYAMLEAEFFPQIQPWYFDANFVRNRIFRSDQEVLFLLKQTHAPEQLGELLRAKQQNFGWRTRPFDYLQDPMGAAVTRALLEGKWRVSELVMRMWDITAYNRLLALRVHAADSRRQKDPAKILHKQELADSTNPFNDQAMVYSVKQRVLWFGQPDCRSVKQVRLPGGRFFTQEEIAALRENYPRQCS